MGESPGMATMIELVEAATRTNETRTTETRFTEQPPAQRSRARPGRDELQAMGRRLRQTCPRRSHAGWTAPPDRPDPLLLLEQSSEGRIPELIPLRYGRMLESPFAWYRGTALHMAADLAHTPATGLRVQACGDAHLANF